LYLTPCVHDHVFRALQMVSGGDAHLAWERTMLLAKVPHFGSSRQSITCASIAGKGRGLLAPNGAQPGETLLRLPVSEAIFESSESTTPWHVNLAKQLLDSSRHKSYTELVLEGLPGSLVATSDASTCGYYPASCTAYDVEMQLDEACKGDALLRRASLSVLSRSLVVFGKRCLLPVIDIVNHGGDSGANLRLSASRTAGEIAATASRIIEPGEELLISYGGDRRGLDDLAMYYGFTYTDSTPYDCGILAQDEHEMTTLLLEQEDFERARVFHQSLRMSNPLSSSSCAASSNVPLVRIGQPRESSVEWTRVPLQMHLNKPEEDVSIPPLVARREGELVDARLVAGLCWDWKAVRSAVQYACKHRIEELDQAEPKSSLASEYVEEKKRTFRRVEKSIS